MQYVYGRTPTVWTPLVLNTHTHTHTHAHTHTHTHAHTHTHTCTHTHTHTHTHNTHTHTQIDNDLRKTWDNFALKLETVDSDPRTGSDVIHWIMKYPVSVNNLHHPSSHALTPSSYLPLHSFIPLLLLPYSLTHSILQHLFHTLPHSSLHLTLTSPLSCIFLPPLPLPVPHVQSRVRISEEIMDQCRGRCHCDCQQVCRTPPCPRGEEVCSCPELLQ